MAVIYDSTEEHPAPKRPKKAETEPREVRDQSTHRSWREGGAKVDFRKLRLGTVGKVRAWD